MEKIFNEIASEREYQKKKFAVAFDDGNFANDWISYITAYGGSAFSYNRDKFSPTFRKQMVKVAALAVAAIEAYDRYVERHTSE